MKRASDRESGGFTVIVPGGAGPQRADDASLSVVIPCYCEAEVLPELFQRVTAAAASWSSDWEVIVVDDGSIDATWELLHQQHTHDPHWKPIRLSRNFGHQLAVWTGLMYADGDMVVVMDADLQDAPEAWPRFFEKWAEGYDVVYGVRRNRKEGIAKRIAYRLFYRVMAWLAEIDIPLDAGDFCVMDRRVVAAMLQSQEKQPFVRGIRSWVGFRQCGLEYDRQARAAGNVKYTFRKLVGLALNGMFSFSTRPLRLATWLGLGVSTVAFLGALFTLVQRVFATHFEKIGLAPVPGYATIVISVVFLGGVQLICLGILGEYVGRIYDTVKGRPPSIVRESLKRASFPTEASP
jgi:glycosyltransferase involved in cell wall biosynthesis